MAPLLVAELSANHLGDQHRAHELVRAAAHAGATHVKFQCWSKGKMVGPANHVLNDGPWKGRDLAELYAETFTPWEWFGGLFEDARRLGVQPFASVFDAGALAFAEGLKPAFHKIASAEIVDLALIAAAASTERPLIISTGMACLPEIEEAVVAAKGCADLTLLRCVSAYPARPVEACLATMADMRKRFSCRVGLSDHSLGCGVAVAATALGADMIEKHLTLRRLDGGPDAAFSMEPEELADMVTACRQAAQAIGQARYGPTKREEPQLALRRSLWWAENLPRGHIVVPGDLLSARPADGLPPKEQPNVLERYLSRDVKRGEPVTWACLAP